MPTFTAKDIKVMPIERKDADRIVKKYHYSGKVVNNSQLSIGVFLGGKLEGAMQFGPSLDKRKIVGLVEGTGWNEFIELNRMAFSDALPRNSESRALAVTFRMMRKFAPHIKWVISFADGTQSGDGAIYRAAGFVLTSIKKNDQIWVGPDDKTVATRLVATDTRRPGRQRLFAGSMTMLGPKLPSAQRREILSRGDATKGADIRDTGSASMKPFIELGWKPLEGFQLRYIYFLDPTARERLTVPILPFSAIEEHKAGMYKGERISRAVSADSGTAGDQPEGGSATLTTALKAEA